MLLLSDSIHDRFLVLDEAFAFRVGLDHGVLGIASAGSRSFVLVGLLLLRKDLRSL